MQPIHPASSIQCNFSFIHLFMQVKVRLNIGHIVEAYLHLVLQVQLISQNMLS